MTPTVVVPLDGSEFAEAALGPATWLATALGADLRLIMTSFVEDSSEHAQYLARHADASGIAGAEGEVLRPHFPGTGIAEYVDERADAVLCMTTHGRSGLGDLLLGGVADEILRTTNAPVLLVGHDARGCELPGGSSMMVCQDGSPASAAIVSTAARWATALGLDIELVTVASAPGGAWDPAQATEALDALAAELTANGQRVSVTVLPPDAHAADRLVDHAASGSVALIAMATHGAGGLLANALGRVVTRVVRHSSRPVLVQRPMDESS